MRDYCLYTSKAESIENLKILNINMNLKRRQNDLLFKNNNFNKWVT